METQAMMIRWIVEKIWMKDSFLEYEVAGESQHVDQKAKDHHDAVHLMFDVLTWWKFQVLSSLSEIGAIGHRVVHGWEDFHDAVLIDDAVIEKINACASLAPLHNPPELAGILACRELVPQIPQVAVFDTAFHQSMEPAHYLYALPYAYYEKYKVRRYWFHWTSHEFVYDKLVERLKGWKVKKLKVITCHVGNWVSITAIQDGKVIETSMGMTPMEGAMMGTRSGNVDPGVMLFLLKNEGMSSDQLGHVMNEESGLLGVSGISGDMRDVLDGYKKQDARCILAVEMYINNIVKYIGSYVALMNWVDAIVLTAGVMERSPEIRKLLVERLAWLGIKLDDKQNTLIEKECIISTKSSKVLVAVIPTNEALMIAKEIYRLIGV